MSKKKPTKKSVETFVHDEASRKNIPTAEHQSVMRKDQQAPIQVAYERRNKDLDPQMVWRGKDMVDWSDLVVPAPPLYIQEKVHPKALIDDLTRRTDRDDAAAEHQIDLFSDFNGIAEEATKTEFYQHDQNWTNRMILGDSLQVMASLAEREGLRGKVQCIYIDPPYGIKFNSNFQWSTKSTTVKDGKAEHITREPEQVKAFRDTWQDGIHSYMTHLRDRVCASRELLTPTGSLFFQIGDENVHRVRCLLDEVMGEENFIAQISFAKTSGYATKYLTGVCDYILWYGRDKTQTKFRQPLLPKRVGQEGATKYTRVRMADGSSRTMTKSERTGNGSLSSDERVWVDGDCTSQGNPIYEFAYQGKSFQGSYKTTHAGMTRLAKAGRIYVAKGSFRYIRYLGDFPFRPTNAAWMDIGGVQSRSDPKIYVVQTATEAVKRCLLMSTDPGDLVLDPTCGAGTTARVAEEWGRRWITIDTSRVALALARARLLGSKYPWYFLSDSADGQAVSSKLTGQPITRQSFSNSIRHGFVYERVSRITLGAIANNVEIDSICEQFEPAVVYALSELNKAVEQSWQEWEVPFEPDAEWNSSSQRLHSDFSKIRLERQQKIDDCISRHAEYEYIFDKPCEDSKRVRVTGPFTVESLSPHRTLGVDENDELIDGNAKPDGAQGAEQDFAFMILENLKTAGVQQAHKEDKINFSSLLPWGGGGYICAEGRYIKGDEDTGVEKRAGIFIGPEFATLSRVDLVAAAREAADAGFDVLISCSFNYEAHASEFNQLGRIPILKARINADLHMADDLKNTGKGNLFVIFGEPDIDIIDEGDNMVRVKINGVDVFKPQTGKVVSDNADGIACWFIDADYNEESFFVRHAYFLGANDPYKSLKRTLKAEINEEAWATLNSDTSRPFKKPRSGRIAVKVINHLGDEVMKVFMVN